MGTVKIKNLSVYKDELAVFFVFQYMTGQKSAEAEKRGIEIKHYPKTNTYKVFHSKKKERL